jgi:hypothetical protein
MSNLITGYINFDMFGNIAEEFNPSSFQSSTVSTQSINTETINITGNTVTNNIDDYGTIDAEHLVIQQSANYLGDISANSSCLCTTEYLEIRFNELLGPETYSNLNSIKELSTAMNNDPQFFMTINNNLNDLSTNFTQADIQINNKLSDLSSNLNTLNSDINDLSDNLLNYKSTVNAEFIQVQAKNNDLSDNLLNYKSIVNAEFIQVQGNIDDLSNNTSFELNALLNTVNGNITTSISDVMQYIDQQDAILLDFIHDETAARETDINTITTNLSTVTTNINDISLNLYTARNNIINLDISTTSIINDISSYKTLNNSIVSDISQTLFNNFISLNQADTSINILLSDMSLNALNLSNNFNSYVTSNNTLINDLSLSLMNNVNQLTSIDNSFNLLIGDLSNNTNAQQLNIVDLSNNINSLSSFINDLSNNKASLTYVNDSISALIDSSPATLNTLNELATALGNDANFSTTITNSIGLRALDSDVMHLTGTETITGNKTFSGTVSGLNKSTVGLSNVDNTTDLLKPISTATQTALNAKQDTLTSSSITDNLLSSTFIKENDDMTLYVNKVFNMNGNIICNTKTITPLELSYLDNLSEPLPTTLTSLQNQLNGLGSVDLSGYQTLISNSNPILMTDVSGLNTSLASKQATLTNGSINDSLLSSTFLKPSTSINVLDLSCSAIISSSNVTFNSASEKFTSIGNNGTVNNYTLNYTDQTSTYILSTAPTANFIIRLNNCGTDTNKAINFCIIYNTTGKWYCNSVSAFSNTSTSVLASTSPIFLGGTPNITTSTIMIQSFSLIRNFGTVYCLSSVGSYY